uniref:Ubiquitin-like domain-containing protein n=1 Tax=Setaria digitata TaxID=48799 RepID=A0A915PVT7_9BILA
MVIDVGINLTMLKSVFPKRSKKRPLEYPINGGNNLLKRTDGEDEVIKQFCFCHDKKLGKESLRLVILAESERRLLFDSETVLPVNTPDIPTKAPLSNCGRFRFLRHRPDVSCIGQMIFGSLSTTKNESFKIHSLSDSKVPVGSVSSADSESPYSTVRSLEGMHRRIHYNSQSTDPPEGFTRVRNISLQLDTEEGSIDSCRAFSPNRLSRHRRMQLAQRGNLCDENNSGRWCSRSRLSSCSSTTDDESKQIAVGVLFREEEKQFLLCHIPLIEIEIIKLEAQILKATLSRTRFLHLLFEAWLELVHNVCLLYNSYRFRSPVWLSLMNEKEYASTASNFCTNLAALICEYDLKSTRYFVSTLLSCVLMNHLAWVASVAPPEDCEDLHRSLLIGTSGSSDCMRYPYNAQLAQYMEVSGSVGGATRLARTVIIGNDMKLITHLLYVLTYFVRCSAIQPNGNKADKWNSQPKMRSFSPYSCSEDGTLDFDKRYTLEEEADKKKPEFVVLREAVEPGVNTKRSEWYFPLISDSGDSTDTSLAWSMLAGPCDSYCSHFVICGLRLAAIDLKETYCSVMCHIKNGESELISASFPESSSSSTASDSAPFSPTVVVLADATNYTVKMISGDDTSVGESQMTAPCDAVVTMLEQFGDLYRLGAAPTFLLSFIEDCLSGILTRSLSLVELLGGTTGNSKSRTQVTPATVTAERVVAGGGRVFGDKLILLCQRGLFPAIYITEGRGSYPDEAVDSKDTVANLKEKIGGILDLFPDAVRLLHQGHPLSNTEASLESYGIVDSSRINVVNVPSTDVNPTISKILSSFFYDHYPPNALPLIAEKYQAKACTYGRILAAVSHCGIANVVTFIQSLAKKVKSFSLEELERYARFIVAGSRIFGQNRFEIFEYRKARSDRTVKRAGQNKKKTLITAEGGNC